MPQIQASFAFSSPHVNGIPHHQLPELAFIGRSNVGKSSLINCLCGRAIAHTSASPGKTLLINHFIVDNAWYIVDLPGYGFAKVSKARRTVLQNMISGYILKSPRLHLLFVLLDIRHPLQDIDRDFLIKLGEAGTPFAIILTKADKLSATAQAAHRLAILNSLSEYWDPLPPCFETSSETGQGKDALLHYIREIL